MGASDRGPPLAVSAPAVDVGGAAGPFGVSAAPAGHDAAASTVTIDMSLRVIAWLLVQARRHDVPRLSAGASEGVPPPGDVPSCKSLAGWQARSDTLARPAPILLPRPPATP